MEDQKIKNRFSPDITNLLAAIVDSSDDAIISKDLNGIITSWNKGAERIFGYTADEMIGKPVTTLIPEDRQHEEPDILARLKKGERVDHFETIRCRKDGGRLDVSLTISPVKDKQGRIVGASKIARDISDRKQAEADANLLAAIVDSSDDAIVSKNLDGIITSWNKGAEQIFGYMAEEVIGKPITTLIPEDRQHEEPDILARLRKGERIDHYETVRRRKDGSFFDVSLTISPVKDRDGRIVGASKIARDITKRKQGEEAIRENEARFRQLADSMPQIVWTARPDGYIDYYNERWYQFTGFDRDQFGDMSWEPVLHPDDTKNCLESWYESVRSGQPFRIEYRFRDRNKESWRWFLGRAVPVRNSTGQIVKWFGTSTEIDEQKRTEDDLRRANQDLEQFAYTASHDLQEPLRTLKIYSQLLAESLPPDLEGEAAEFLDYLKNAASRMELLVRDLLAYSRITQLASSNEKTNANDVLAATLTDLEGLITEAEATVTYDSLPVVRINEIYLKQLFQNLIGNAIKYRSPDRVPVVHISADRDDEFWIFTVRDNGIGIDPQYKEKIFGLFKRLHARDAYSGTGIGLAICQRIVDQFHGRIWVESEPGKGSVFCFSLPV